MDSEFKQYLRLTLIIMSVIMIASLGLMFESLEGFAWLLATPVVVGVFLLYRYLKTKKGIQLQPENSKNH